MKRFLRKSETEFTKGTCFYHIPYNETPYKSVMLSKGKGEMDERSLSIIENAIQACGKFQFRSDKYKPEVYADFQLIDWTLIESGLASADAW